MGARKAGARHGKVNWYAEDVVAHFTKVSERAIEAAAARVDALAKMNIVANDQVDTGFMVNSVYFATAETSTYQDGSGTQVNREGNFVEREMAPEATLPDNATALVCVGANYAIFQEMANPFLYPALLAVKGEMKGIIETVAKSD
ncbi:MAG: hypothetical protein IPJ94_09645 [Chloroflexi bacterium]|nr:hypothetical protein [Chloroflexota bacterium]